MLEVKDWLVKSAWSISCCLSRNITVFNEHQTKLSRSEIELRSIYRVCTKVTREGNCSQTVMSRLTFWMNICTLHVLEVEVVEIQPLQCLDISELRHLWLNNSLILSSQIVCLKTETNACLCITNPYQRVQNQHGHTWYYKCSELLQFVHLGPFYFSFSSPSPAYLIYTAANYFADSNTYCQ